MKIAQVSPLYESVRPKLYGGTERVVHWLVEELVRQGHVELRQTLAFGPLFVRRRSGERKDES